MTQSQSPTCFPPTCVTTINEGGTGYSHADRQTAWDEPGLGKHSGWRNPSWVDNDTVMISDPTHLPNYDVILDTISDGDTGNLVHDWFSDTVEGNPHMSGGDMSRDRTKLAFATGENDTTLTDLQRPDVPDDVQGRRRPGQHPAARLLPLQRPSGRRSAPRRSRPTAAASRGPRATASRSSTVPSFAGGCTTDGASPTAALLIPGGKQPDWGPADVPAGRGATGGGLAAKAAKAKLAKALAKGLSVRVRVPAAGRLSAAATRSGRKVASGAKARQGRHGAVKLRFTKAARRSLKHARSVKLRIKVAFKPAGGATQRTTVAVTLKR